MQNKTYRYAWFLIVLLSASLACQLVSRVSETKATVQAVASEAKGRVQILGTARAMITQVDGSEMLKTAQAVATELGESGLMETAVAAATEEGPGLIETAQAFATNEGPGLEETVQASMGEAPEDIPIIEGDKENFVGGEFLVSYSVAMSFQDVVDFYKREMTANGWTKVDQGSVEAENTAALKYEKSDRNAEVTITFNPVDSKTFLIILISEK
jgi:hypothetical protein